MRQVSDELAHLLRSDLHERAQVTCPVLRSLKYASVPNATPVRFVNKVALLFIAVAHHLPPPPSTISLGYNHRDSTAPNLLDSPTPKSLLHQKATSSDCT